MSNLNRDGQRSRTDRRAQLRPLANRQFRFRPKQHARPADVEHLHRKRDAQGEAPLGRRLDARGAPSFWSHIGHISLRLFTMVICPSARESPCSGRDLPAVARNDARKSSPKLLIHLKHVSRRLRGSLTQKTKVWLFTDLSGESRLAWGLAVRNWDDTYAERGTRPAVCRRPAGAGGYERPCSCHWLTRPSRSIRCDSERFTNSRPTRKRLACGASGTGETCRTTTVIGEVRCSKAS